MRSKASTLSALLLLLLPLTAMAELPYRGTSLVYRNSVSALSMAPSGELSYNPYYSMIVNPKLMWWFSESYFVAGEVELERELTRSDSTTHAGEFVASDTELKGGAIDFWSVPYVDIALSAVGQVVLPTSKAAWSETLVLGTSAALTAERRFQVLEGLSLSYTFKPNKNFHRYTTSERSSPTVRNCSTSPGGCSRFLNTGSRNVSWSMTHDLAVFVAPTSWLSLEAEVATVTGFLYPLGSSEQVTYQVNNPSDSRFLNFYRLGATFTPMPSFDVAVGASTLNPQLQPDSQYYFPVFNRYTNFYVDLKLNMAGLMAQLTGKVDNETDMNLQRAQ